MRLRQLSTVFALGVSLLMASGCAYHRCCCRHRGLFHRRAHECCGCETCGYHQTGCNCGTEMPIHAGCVPIGPAGVPVGPAGVPVGPAGAPVGPAAITAPGAVAAPMPSPTMVTPSH